MGKQSDRKLAQGYNENPVPRTCSTCEKYQSEFVTDNDCFGVSSRPVITGNNLMVMK